MNKLVLICFGFLIGAANTAYAINCPKQTLECSIYKINSDGNYFVELKQTAKFIGVNNSEPSEEPNECIARNIVNEAQTGLDVYFVGEVVGNSNDFQAFLYVGRGSGAMSPQFQLVPELNKPFSMTYLNEKFTCVVK